MTQDSPFASEITVRDGHLLITLTRLDDGWHAHIESALEGRIFDGHVTELRDLLVGNPITEAILESDGD